MLSWTAQSRSNRSSFRSGHDSDRPPSTEKRLPLSHSPRIPFRQLAGDHPSASAVRRPREGGIAPEQVGDPGGVAPSLTKGANGTVTERVRFAP